MYRIFIKDIPNIQNGVYDCVKIDNNTLTLEKNLIEKLPTEIMLIDDVLASSKYEECNSILVVCSDKVNLKNSIISIDSELMKIVDSTLWNENVNVYSLLVQRGYGSTTSCWHGKRSKCCLISKIEGN